jgi:hypothetical protein
MTIGPSIDPMSSVENAAVELIKTGVMGTLLVLVGSFAIWAIYKWNQVNEKRVEDQQKMTLTLLEVATEWKNGIKDMTMSINNLKTATDDERRTLDKLESTIDSVVRDAVKK